MKHSETIHDEHLTWRPSRCLTRKKGNRDEREETLLARPRFYRAVLVAGITGRSTLLDQQPQTRTANTKSPTWAADQN
jgi:hypothetical protein